MSTPWDDAPAFMDFDEPMGHDERVAKGLEGPGSKRAGKKSSKKAPGDDDKREMAVIPVLPPREPIATGDELRRGVTDRDRSAVNLRLDGSSFGEIADLLEYKDAADAKKAVERALAATHSIDEWDSLRMIAAARAERAFARSTAMASADYLVDSETREKVANTERARWHQLAQTDLMNWATIVGAKAPTKIDITPDEERMDQIIGQLLAQMGHEEIMEAEVIELTAIPAETVDDAQEEWDR